MVVGDNPLRQAGPPMRSYKGRRFEQQASFLRLSIFKAAFKDVFSETTVVPALQQWTSCGLDRVYSPLVTLWAFSSHVLSAYHSCRAVVARLIAHRPSRGGRPCSATTGTYCPRRGRLGGPPRRRLCWQKLSSLGHQGRSSTAPPATRFE
jgi:hypothetical protein